MSDGGAGHDAVPPGAGARSRPGAAGPSAEDLEHLRSAVVLGRRGRGRVEPNPAVGCVIMKDGAVVGAGWHEEFGAPHAEAHALEAAGAAARGATAYVSLEPCRHEGKTPACTGALLRSGVARVVYGAADPTADAGGGASVLRDAGVEVLGPVLSPREARAENPSFFHRAVTGRPWVAAKLATTLDARIAAAPGERTRLTGAPSRRAVHRLRAGFDAVVVGSGTALVDDPLLTVREDVPMRRPPARVVLDSRCRLSPDAALFRDADGAPVVVFTRTDAPEHAIERLEDAGATVHPVPGADDGLDLAAVLDVCGETGLLSLLVEGGSRLLGSLLRADLVERLHLFTAPLLLGEGAVPAFPDPVPDALRPAARDAADGDAEDVADPADGDAAVARWTPLGATLHGDDVAVVWERARPWSHGPGDQLLWER